MAKFVMGVREILGGGALVAAALLAVAASEGARAEAVVASAAEAKPQPPPAAALAAPGPEIEPRMLRKFAPLRARFDPPGRVPTEAQIQLGRMLFYDTRLSADNDLSCNSCHPLERYGVDGEPFSIGRKGQRGRRNSPTVFNAAGHFQQFWDGRAPDVEAQAAGPILNGGEMGMYDRKTLEARLRGVAGYEPLFRAAFPGVAQPIILENVALAVAAFERGLSTPSRWDRYLKGDLNALTQAEKDGFKTFSEVGCAGCHRGEFVGADRFQRAGVTQPWPNQLDCGRAEVTKSPDDKMVFKVPSLRNIIHTGPYFHDASAVDLPTAVRTMATVQIGSDLTQAEVDSIIVWLKVLTGTIDTAYIARPTLPQ
jgi:cytochrome c peroxidase